MDLILMPATEKLAPGTATPSMVASKWSIDTLYPDTSRDFLTWDVAWCSVT